jgi:hypothetical protein
MGRSISIWFERGCVLFASYHPLEDFTVSVVPAIIRAMGFQTNIALTQSAADWLDTQALAIRKNKRTYVSRSAFVRAVVHGIANSGLDLSHCQSEAAIATCLSIVIRVFLKVPLTPELPMYTTEPLGTKRVVYTEKNAAARLRTVPLRIEPPVRADSYAFLCICTRRHQNCPTTLR